VGHGKEASGAEQIIVKLRGSEKVDGAEQCLLLAVSSHLEDLVSTQSGHFLFVNLDLNVYQSTEQQYFRYIN